MAFKTCCLAPEPYTPVLHDLAWAVMRLHWLLSHADLFLTARMLVLFMPFSRVKAGPCGIWDNTLHDTTLINAIPHNACRKLVLPPSHIPLVMTYFGHLKYQQILS